MLPCRGRSPPNTVSMVFSVAMLDSGKMYARSPAELDKNINLKELFFNGRFKKLLIGQS